MLDLGTKQENVSSGQAEKREGKMRLQGKTAIVTGGAQGIGKVVSQKLAREGANVVIADIQAEPLRETADDIRKLGRKCLGIRTDVAEEADVIEMVEKTLTHFGRIDILINNAGGRINTPPLWKRPPGNSGTE